MASVELWMISRFFRISSLHGTVSQFWVWHHGYSYDLDSCGLRMLIPQTGPDPSPADRRSPYETRAALWRASIDAVTADKSWWGRTFTRIQPVRLVLDKELDQMLHRVNREGFRANIPRLRRRFAWVRLYTPTNGCARRLAPASARRVGPPKT